MNVRKWKQERDYRVRLLAKLWGHNRGDIIRVDFQRGLEMFANGTAEPYFPNVESPGDVLPEQASKEVNELTVEHGSSSAQVGIVPREAHAGVRLDIAAVPLGLRSGARGGKALSKARAKTVAQLIRELDELRLRMFEDDLQYEQLKSVHSDFLAFQIAEDQPKLKRKLMSIHGSAAYKALAQEFAAAHFGKELTTIITDWKRYKPDEFKRR